MINEKPLASIQKTFISKMRQFACFCGLISFIFLVAIVPAHGELLQIAPDTYVAGVTSQQFEFFAAPLQAGRQRQENWCWAACVQMMLNFHGLRATQEEIVQKVFGAQIDSPARLEEIIYALSGWRPNHAGSFSVVQAGLYSFTPKDLIDDLAYRWPLIVGLRNDNGTGHAVILTAVSFRMDAMGNPRFQRVIIRDPWPGLPSRQEISWEEFQHRAVFLLNVRVWRD